MYVVCLYLSEYWCDMHVQACVNVRDMDLRFLLFYLLCLILKCFYCHFYWTVWLLFARFPGACLHYYFCSHFHVPWIIELLSCFCFSYLILIYMFGIKPENYLHFAALQFSPVPAFSSFSAVTHCCTLKLGADAHFGGLLNFFTLILEEERI